jgi:hypothetical protein
VLPPQAARLAAPEAEHDQQRPQSSKADRPPPP